jgi:hypothetical protein
MELAKPCTLAEASSIRDWKEAVGVCGGLSLSQAVID